MTMPQDPLTASIQQDEDTLQQLIREQEAIEGRLHEGFRDAAEGMRLRSEIGELEEQLLRSRQQARERGL